MLAPTFSIFKEGSAVKKRILLVVLCIAMVIAALPVTADAEWDAHSAMYQQVKDIYKKTLRATGMNSMSGYCGMLASYSLYYLGVTQEPEIYNGNEHFDEFAAQYVTTGGHQVKPYSAEEYTLEGALNAITRGGTQDAFNILVGFQKTKYAGGNIYGHVVVIHGIVDGVVYSIDNSRTAIAGNAGTPIVCTIAEFAAEYDSWATFDGAVDFGTKSYANACKSYGTDLYISAIADTELLALPQSSEGIRAVVSGERLWATDLYVGSDGLYYRVSDGDATGYIAASDVRVVLFNTDSLSVSGINIPTTLKKNRDYNISGYIQFCRSELSSVTLEITDDKGNPVIRCSEDLQGQGFNLWNFNRELDFRTLDSGTYQVTVYANARNRYVADGKMLWQDSEVSVFSQTLTISGGSGLPEISDTIAPEAVRDGWFCENGKWYCYRNGEPRTGWYCYDGVDYYLRNDGSVTTGRVNINGQDRFFTATGAMRTGWMELDGNTYYLLSNGVAAKGWREIDGIAYFFGEDGALQTV